MAGAWLPANAQSTASTQLRVTLPSGTPIHLQLAETISTAKATVGQRVPFVVVEDVVQDGVTVISAGTQATGAANQGTTARKLNNYNSGKDIK